MLSLVTIHGDGWRNPQKKITSIPVLFPPKSRAARFHAARDYTRSYQDNVVHLTQHIDPMLSWRLCNV